MKKSKLTTADPSMYKAFMIGVIISVATLLFLVMVSALMISNENITIDTSNYLAGVVQFIATFVGCLVAGKLNKNRIVCLIVTGACVFVQIAAAILLFGGISGGFIPGLIANFAGCGGAFLLCISRNNRSVNKRRRVRSR